MSSSSLLLLLLFLSCFSLLHPNQTTTTGTVHDLRKMTAVEQLSGGGHGVMHRGGSARGRGGVGGGSGRGRGGGTNVFHGSHRIPGMIGGAAAARSSNANERKHNAASSIYSRPLAITIATAAFGTMMLVLI